MFRPMWPREATPRELRHEARLARRAARREERAARIGGVRQSVGRLRTRFRRSTPGGQASGMAIGISVDPPDMEEWVAGNSTQDEEPKR
jgi:hypothetical protein